MWFIELIRFWFRNRFSSKGLISLKSTYNIRHSRNVVNAMNQYRKENKICVWCGKSPIEVHHIIPIWYDSNLADDPKNFISLCKKCHFVLGHEGNYHKFIKNVKEICESKKEFKND